MYIALIQTWRRSLLPVSVVRFGVVATIWLGKCPLLLVWVLKHSLDMITYNSTKTYVLRISLHYQLVWLNNYILVYKFMFQYSYLLLMHCWLVRMYRLYKSIHPLPGLINRIERRFYITEVIFVFLILGDTVLQIWLHGSHSCGPCRDMYLWY